MLRFIVIMFFAVLLAGCTTIFGRNSYFASQDSQYIYAREAAPVRLPSNLNSAALSDDYTIPPAAGRPPSAPISKLPPGSLVAGIEQGTIPKSVLKEKPIGKEAPSLNAVRSEPDLAPNNPFQRDGLTQTAPVQ